MLLTAALPCTQLMFSINLIVDLRTLTLATDTICLFHPFLPYIHFMVTGVLEPFWAITGWKTEYTLKMLSVYHSVYISLNCKRPSVAYELRWVPLWPFKPHFFRVVCWSITPQKDNNGLEFSSICTTLSDCGLARFTLFKGSFKP